MIKTGSLIPTTVRNYVPFLTNSVEAAFAAVPAELAEESQPEIPANPELLELPQSVIAKLKAKAESVEHLLSHNPFNPFCASCVQGRSKHSYARRTTPEYKVEQEAEAKHVSDILLGDHG